MIANVIDRTIHPLPLPPFRTLHSLSLHELKCVCRKHAAIHENLAQSVVITRRESTLQLPADHGAVCNVAFLPGGRHILTMSMGGLFLCWDIDVELDTLGEGISGGVVGKLLASHNTGIQPSMWNFNVQGREVLVALYGTARR